MDVSTPPGDSTTGGPRLTPELLLTPTMVGEGSAVGVMTSMDATTLMTPAMEWYKWRWW